jgi:UDP-3-O-[3-hydroxymyristoyl] N-acetylglucosamine deacetylase
LNGQQTTLKSRVSLSGIGVHGGKPVSVHLNPADADTGVIFHVNDSAGNPVELRAIVSEVGATDMCTVIGRPDGVHVATVEHLMASLLAMRVDNVSVEIDGAEMPILDGSAQPIIEAIEQAGIETLSAPRRYIRVLKPIRTEIGGSWAEFRPYDGSRFEVEIDYDTPAIGRQSFAFDLDTGSFRVDVARARTFGFMKDVERLWAAGYALGSSLENSVVIGDDHRVINMGGLRYPDEFVRHKMLDSIGDLALAGARIIGLFRSYRGGHRLNATVLRTLLSDRSAFEIVETDRRSRGRSGKLVAVSTPAYAPWTI